MKPQKNNSFESMLFTQLYTEYDSLPEATKNTELGVNVRSAINAIKVSMPDVDIADAFALERQILQLAPKDSLGLEAD
jgi:hypothetical protein